MSKRANVLSTTREVTAALGGTKAVANLTGRKYTAAANWLLESKGQFPPDTYLVMTVALTAIGKSAPASLWRMVAPEKEAAS